MIQKKYPEAIKEFQESLYLFKECGIRLGIAIACAAIGHCRLKNNQFNKARKCW